MLHEEIQCNAEQQAHAENSRLLHKNNGSVKVPSNKNSCTVVKDRERFKITGTLYFEFCCCLALGDIFQVTTHRYSAINFEMYGDDVI